MTTVETGTRRPGSGLPAVEGGGRRSWATVAGATLPWNTRAVTVVTIASGAVVVVTVLALWLGDLGVAPWDLPRVLGGGGSRPEHWSVFDNRLPRALVAIGAGAAMGVSGAIFQSVTRNPLGSPDIIGLNAGAAAGAAASALVWPGVVPVPLGALIGGGIAVVLVVGGAGRGIRAPYRMVVVGIGVGASSLAFVQFVVTRARREDAVVLASWLNGSLGARNWEHVAVAGITIVAFGSAALLVTRGLQIAELGDDLASAVGVRPGRTRWSAVSIGVGLSAGAVVVAGPVAFVSLVAPQVARRLTRSTGPGLVAAGTVGALLLAAADVLAVHGPFASPVPVGIMTAGLGGVYLAVLLMREWRKGTT